MKTILTSMMILSFAGPAFAQTVEKDLGGNGDWKAAMVAGHDYSKKNACIAYVKSADGNSRLELYAEQEGANHFSFTEPTVQVVTKEAGYVRAVLSDANAAEPYNLTLESTRDAQPAFGLLARFGDRAKLLDMLKRASNAKLQLVNAKGKLLKTLTFSLRGSTKTIETAVSGCKLVL